MFSPNQNQLKMKKKHRRGKPKPKNASKPFKNSNWKFQMPNIVGSGGGCAGGSLSHTQNRQRTRAKLLRSNSLAPYNTNRFLMEEHMLEVPTLSTPSGRTRDSSFSVDSEDNYFFSLPEDEEDFLTKEFSNVYEKARVERLEVLSKEELIQECLQIEDRYVANEQQNVQRISAEFMSRIRSMEQKIKEISRENYNLRCQLLRSNTLGSAAAASPPSAAAPTSTACQPIPMESSSEDTESDSSSSSSSSDSSCSPNSSDSSSNENDALLGPNVMAIDAEAPDEQVENVDQNTVNESAKADNVLENIETAENEENSPVVNNPQDVQNDSNQADKPSREAPKD